MRDIAGISSSPFSDQPTGNSAANTGEKHQTRSNRHKYGGRLRNLLIPQEKYC